VGKACSKQKGTKRQKFVLVDIFWERNIREALAYVGDNIKMHFKQCY
jgi:hypothetical protein